MDERIKPTEVVIVDFKMPFLSAVVLMIKFAFAAIPAALVIAFGYMLIGAAIVAGHK